MAKDEYGLTPKQRAFADEYILNKGNGTQAYLKVYKNVKNANTAGVNASESLRNPKVARYIREKTEMTLLERDLLTKEAIESLTDLALGVEISSRSTIYNNITGELEQDVTYTNSAPPKVRADSLALLFKFLGIDDPNKDLTRVKQELEIKKLEQQLKENESQTATDNITIVDTWTDDGDADDSN